MLKPCFLGSGWTSPADGKQRILLSFASVCGLCSSFIKLDPWGFSQSYFLPCLARRGVIEELVGHLASIQGQPTTKYSFITTEQCLALVENPRPRGLLARCYHSTANLITFSIFPNVALLQQSMHSKFRAVHLCPTEHTNTLANLTLPTAYQCQNSPKN